MFFFDIHPGLKFAPPLALFNLSRDSFPGVNSRAELVPSHGASRRWLGDNNNNELHAKVYSYFN